jgi:hypothetical protein
MPTVMHIRKKKTGLQALARLCCKLVKLITRWRGSLVATTAFTQDTTLVDCLDSLVACASKLCQYLEKEVP